MVQHGSFTRLVLDGAEYSSYFNNSTLDAEGAVEDVTTYGAPNMAKMYARTQNSGKFTGKGFFDPLVLDPKLAPMRTASTTSLLTIGYAGLALGSPVETAALLESKYDITSPADKVAKIDAEGEVTGPLTFGVSLHNLVAETATNSGSSYQDILAATTNGGWGQLHVTSLTGTTPSVTVTLQHSADNSTWVTLVSFAAATTAGAQRIQVAAGTTVNAYLRAIWAITGTSPSIVFTTSFART